MKSLWKRLGPGRYESRQSGWIIEAAFGGGWNVVNPETGKVADTLPTKRAAQAVYS